MNTDELTHVATAHQAAISRHDQEMAEIRATLAAGARQQQLNHEAIANLSASVQELRQGQAEQQHNIEALTQAQQRSQEEYQASVRRQQHTMEAIAQAQQRNEEQQQANIRLQQLNHEAIANLTASIQELRNLVADYIQGRS